MARVRKREPAIVAQREVPWVTTYHAMLRDPVTAATTHKNLTMVQRDLDIQVAGRLLCNVLRPRVLTDAEFRTLQECSETLASLLERIGSVILGSDHLLDLIGTSETERRIWEIDPGYPGITLTSRLDSFMVDGHPRFIEYNAESPASIGFCDVLAAAFRRLPATGAAGDPSSLRDFSAREAMLATLLWAYRASGREGTPSLAIVDWAHVVTRRDFELCADYFRTAGIPAVIVDPRDLDYRGGALYAGDRRITLVYRRVLLHELLAKADEAQGLLDAYRDGAVCMVNSPRSKLLHKKSVFALLSDGTLDAHLDAAERDLVERHIPWTRLWRRGETTYDGAPARLEEVVREEQPRLVLKPVDDYGGKGVILGWEVTPEEWDTALLRAEGQGYVLQERVSVPEESFPVWRDGAVTMEPLIVDTDPLLFRCRVGGVLTRVSAGALLNVSAGTGGSTATFVTEGSR
ncbi:MAG TPA: circularly permuted type 2 ATP-grasp protein [Chloroflexota bacterium]|nr:circularly permuted type 2 ATP-grasp protein [Chloroflexota bacterium]